MEDVHLTRGRRFGRARAHFVEPAEDRVSCNRDMRSCDHGP